MSCRLRERTLATVNLAITRKVTLLPTNEVDRRAHRPRHYERRKKVFFSWIFGTSHSSPQNTKMESTRVFVGGLPPTCSNDQLKKHFGARFQVTDAHVLPKRRMGFVGFKSHEAAQQAVKHFNRTYMKMSKITVDIARPVCRFPQLLLQPFSFRPCTLTNEGGLETDPYHCRSIQMPLRMLIQREDVIPRMIMMHRWIITSSARGMARTSHRIPSYRSISL